MKLKHKDLGRNIERGTQHLSYGEKNAFALVLFMHQSLRENPNLLILDDPVSSFDRNKKFAILETLFRKDKSFKNKTVLFMTHDFEPIVDMIYNFYDKFQKPTASFLESRNGIIKEVSIKRDDIMTFAKICHEQIISPCDDVIKLIYLRRRYEVSHDKSDAYQLLSNLLHKRAIPTYKKFGENERDMTDLEIANSSVEIAKDIQNFDYKKLLLCINDDKIIKNLYASTTNNYEKLSAQEEGAIDQHSMANLFLL